MNMTKLKLDNFDLRYYTHALRHMCAWTICWVFSDLVTYALP